MNILFLCPYSAAKSVPAAAVAKRKIESHRLSINVAYAGPEPNVQIMPSVAVIQQHVLALLRRVSTT